MEAAGAARLKGDEAEADRLHRWLAACLSVDVERYPHCQSLCEAGTDLYRAGQAFFLRTANAKATTAQQLIRHTDIRD